MVDAPERVASEARPASKLEPKRLGDVHSPWLWLVLIALSGLVFAGVLYITRYMNFFYDEWDFISWFRPPQSTQIWVPHNEHWSTLPILAWKLLFVLFGIRSHIPYEAALLVVHIANVFLLFALIRRRSGDLPAFAAALTLLVLGSGGSDIVWAFQLGFVGSVAFGLLAMLLLEVSLPFPSRMLAVSAALICSLMCSAIGLAFLAAVGVELYVDPGRRHFMVALAAPATAFAAWFLVFDTGAIPGSPGVSGSLHHGPIDLGYIGSLVGFVASGVEASVAGIFGFTGIGAALLPIVAALLAVHWYRQGTIQSWQIGMTAGVLAQFAVTGLGRAQNGPTAAGESRYVYVGAVFLLPLVADAARELPWRKLWRPALSAAFALCLFANVVQLGNRAYDPVPALHFASQADIIRTENAELQTLEVFRGAPDMSLYQPLDNKIMPQLVAARYFAATDELGSPVPPASLDTLKHLPPQTVDQVMLNLFGAAMTLDADSKRSTQGMPCRNVDSTAGSTMDFAVPNGQPLMLQSSKGGDASLFLWFLGPPPSEPLRTVQLPAATPEWLHTPDTGTPSIWQLRIKTAAMGVVRVCGTPSLQLHQTVNYLYHADAGSGALDAGWSSVPDAAAFSGHAAKAARGTKSFKRDVFGAAFVPIPGNYDVWYHAKVTNPRGVAAEMTLGLWDDTGVAWVGSTTYKAKQLTTDYGWVKVASGVSPPAGHYVQMIASTSTSAALGTDWFVDDAIIQQATAAAP